VTSSTKDWLIASIVIAEEKIRWASKEFVSYKTKLVRMEIPALLQPKSFRPISLTSFLLQTMERPVDLHIKKGSLKDHPFNLVQHAHLKKQID
jgi:hypothetical protein